MASFCAYLLNPLIRWQVGRRLGGALDVSQVRAVFEGAQLPGPRGVQYIAASVGTVDGEWVEAHAASGLVLLYLHGGGYVAGTPRTHRPITGGFAQRGLRVFVPEYRRPPEHPFPAAVEDGVAAYRGLLTQGIAPEALAIAGESAGGGLALAVLLAARAAGLALPACAVLFSPWVDLTCTGETWQTNAQRDPMLRRVSAQQLARLYLKDAPPETPLASPLYADLAGLPPMLIHVGEREVLRDDATRLAERLRVVGVAAGLKIWPVVPHAWQLFPAFLPEARQSLEQAARFIRAHRRADL
ncbi:alpha/beta hydrolase [Thiomonas sp.]